MTQTWYLEYTDVDETEPCTEQEDFTFRVPLNSWEYEDALDEAYEVWDKVIKRMVHIWPSPEKQYPHSPTLVRKL